MILALLGLMAASASGLVELRLTEGEIVVGPKEVEGKKLGDFSQWYTGNNASMSLSKDAPNGRYDVRWSVDCPLEAEGLVLVASLRKTNRNQKNELFVSFDAGKTWKEIGRNTKGWIWEPITLTWPLYEHPADGKILISWRFSKPHNGDIWRVAIRDVEVDAAYPEELKEMLKTGRSGWFLAGKIVRGKAILNGKQLGQVGQWFESIDQCGVFLTEDAPNGKCEVRWSANVPDGAKAVEVSADLRKNNRNQGNTLSASCDGGQTWKEIGRNTPKGWVWENVKEELLLPPSVPNGQIILRWTFNKPHNGDIWRLGIKNINVN